MIKQVVSSISVILIVTLFIFNACDIVEEPYTNPVDENNEESEVVQKVLLEEFTGHQCPNCPEGTELAKQLKNLYGDKFIIIAYHAGWFARTSSSFTTDYTTLVGDNLNDAFEIQANPSGLINRRANVIEGDELVLSSTQWSSATAIAIEEEPKLKLSISHTYNSSNQTLSVTVNATTLSEVNPMLVNVFITENNVVSPQKTTSDDPNANEDGVIIDYMHNNVFRASLNGTWGTKIFEEAAGVNESESITVNGTISSDWNESNLSIVCFAYNEDDGSIVQADYTSLL